MGTHASPRAALAALALSGALAACAAFAGSAGDDDAEGDARGQGSPGAPTILEDGAVLPPSGDDASLPSDAGRGFDSASVVRVLTFENGRAIDADAGADGVGATCLAAPAIDRSSKLGGVHSLAARDGLRCVAVEIVERDVWIRFGLYIESVPPQASASASVVELRTEASPNASGVRVSVRRSGELELIAFADNAVGAAAVAKFTPLVALLHVAAGDPGEVEAFVVKDGEWERFAQATLSVPTLGKLRLGITNPADGVFFLDDIVIARSMPPVP